MELSGTLHYHQPLLGNPNEKMSAHSHSQNHLLIFLLIIFFFIKLALIKHVPFINDEAYALTISKYFSLSYFDHPPLMMWISYFFHFFEPEAAYSFRIPHVIFGILTSFFLYQIGSLIYSKQTGVFAAILYFISPFFFFSGGFFVVPDAPLNFSVAGATYFAIKIIFENKSESYLWFALGLLLAIAFLSKYQSYLFALALFIAFIIWKKSVFLNPNFYISLIIAVCGLLPVIIWNIDNGFESFNFHQSRSSYKFNIFHAVNSIFLQSLFILPTTSILIFLSLVNYAKDKKKEESFLILLSLPTILTFNFFMMASENSFAHWSMMGWMLIIPMAANSLNLFKSFIKKFVILKVLNIVLFFSLILVLSIHAHTGFLTKSYLRKVPEWDDTRELLNWNHIAETIGDNLKEDELKSLVTLNWYDSGQLNVALNHKYHVGVIGTNTNHFRHINLNSGNFYTLIVVQLLNNEKHEDLTDLTRKLGYKVSKVTTLPFLRGSRVYGTIKLLSIEKDY